MKKIIPFLLFLLLFIGSIYVVFQFKNKDAKKITNSISQKEEKKVPTPTVKSTNLSSSSSTIQKDDQINLIISAPVSGETVDTKTVTVAGSTEAGATIVVNDSEITAGKDGSFKSVVSLDEGENYISIVAYNDLGNVAEREILITRTVSGL
jgi:predicted DNA repair protein MutK